MKHLLIALSLFSIIFFSPTEKAHAVGAITGIDPVQLVKELGLDTLAWIGGAILSEILTADTANWINTGFKEVVRLVEEGPDGMPEITFTETEGGSSFVLDPSEFFKQVSIDSAYTFVGKFIEVDEEAFAPGLKQILARDLALEAQRMQDDFLSSFESDITEQDMEVYLDNFSSGGWDMFLKTTQICANNYNCARIAVVNELDSEISQAVSEVSTELDQGAGFLTIRECIDVNTSTGECGEYTNVTPGKVLAEQIIKATNVEFDRTNDADEITEILVNLVQQALQSLINQGLSSLADNIAASFVGGQPASSSRLDAAKTTNETLMKQWPKGGTSGESEEFCIGGSDVFCLPMPGDGGSSNPDCIIASDGTEICLGEGQAGENGGGAENGASEGTE